MVRITEGTRGGPRGCVGLTPTYPIFFIKTLGCSMKPKDIKMESSQKIEYNNDHGLSGDLVIVNKSNQGKRK